MYVNAIRENKFSRKFPNLQYKVPDIGFTAVSLESLESPSYRNDNNVMAVNNNHFSDCFDLNPFRV